MGGREVGAVTSTFEIITLGCKVNTYESEAMAGLLEESGRYKCAGKQQGETYGHADIFILNSCMVTEESEKKAAKIIRRVKRENPGCTVAVTGCMSQMVPEKVLKLGADVVLGNTSRREILEALDAWFETKERQIDVKKHEKGEKFEILAPKGYKNLTRANLKIEDGCDCYCSYCIIPFARGHVRSMPPEEIFREAKELIQAGHREIVLTGINIGMYGREIGKTIADAVRAVKEAGAERIRLGSLEIDLLSIEIIKELAEIEGLCPHFHTSLQSGSDTVLKRMNRKYTTEEYFSLIQAIRENFRDPSITTDVIVGFAGETEEEFCETLAFVKKVGFAKVHVFPYSRREGTVGARLPDQVSNEVKKARSKTMGKAADELFRSFISAHVGTRQSVLFETEQDGFYYGHTENYMYVCVKSDENLKNIIKNVEITGFNDEIASGIVIS